MREKEKEKAKAKKNKILLIIIFISFLKKLFFISYEIIELMI